MIKKGDCVMLLVDNPHGGFLKRGDRGIVRAVIGDEAAVEFPFDFHDSHDCDGHVPTGNGWYIHIDYLYKIG